MIRPLLPLVPGQELGLRWRTAEGLVADHINRLGLNPMLNGAARDIPSFVTFVDAKGVSVYIVRGMRLGGDIHGFIDTTKLRWNAYFEPFAAIVSDYAGTAHATKAFPLDF